MATPEAVATPAPENYGALLQRARALQQGGTPEEKKEATGLGNALASANYGADNPDRWHSPNQVENPVRFQLRAGFVIPGVLLSGVNSEVPGTIIAQVAQDVYDNATGSDLLIPQGARLIGSYSSNVQYGQSRLFVVWQRIVFPDGRALDIGAEPGTDSAGYAGFKDRVDSHWVQIFGSAVMMSAISAGISYSQDRYQQGNGNYYAPPRFSDELSQAVGQQFGQAAAKRQAERGLLALQSTSQQSLAHISAVLCSRPAPANSLTRSASRNEPGASPLPIQGFPGRVTDSQDRRSVRPRGKQIPQGHIKGLCPFLALDRDARAPLVKTTDDCRHSSASCLAVGYQIHSVTDIHL